MRAAVDRGSRQRKETGMAEAIDDVDRNILAVLQEDASLALEEIARRVGASKTPVWNRIRKMKERGIIRGEVAIVDPEKIGLESCFFVLIRTSQHDAAWLEKFLRAVQARPEVLEAHRLAGDIDYILKVRVASAKAYDAFYQSLISDVSIFNVTSTLSMEEIKNTTALPLDAAR
jgi:Lrp/AsnC family transcriptional regulator